MTNNIIKILSWLAILPVFLGVYIFLDLAMDFISQLYSPNENMLYELRNTKDLTDSWIMASAVLTYKFGFIGYVSSYASVCVAPTQSFMIVLFGRVGMPS